MRYSTATAILAVTILLAGCADNSVGKFRVGSAYDIKGKTYYPQESYTTVQTGIVSWYGPGFDGKKTANGERFDEDALTAAHPTLQMPSLVRVTNLENGRTLVVRVNDRGPFHSNRIMDLSKGAAKRLGVIATGTANVRIQVLGPESRALAQAAKQGVDTRGAEIAMNDTGHLDAKFASFYPSLVAAPQPDVMIAASTYQPGLPAGAQVVTAETLSVPQDAPIQTAMADTNQSIVVNDTASPVTALIAADQMAPVEPVPVAPPVTMAQAAPQHLPTKHKAAIFQMAPIAEANAGEMSGIPPVALAGANYMPSKPKFLGMRPVVDDSGR